MELYTFLFACILLGGSSAFAELKMVSTHHGYCTLWEHRDIQGARLRMANGERVSFAHSDIGSTSWSERQKWNKMASSATIDRGCRLQVWEDKEGKGESKTWSGGSKGLRIMYFGDTWNDRISSAVIRRGIRTPFSG